jgi:hypothetical protein
VPNNEFVIESVGHRVTGDFQDIGVEYYRFVPDLASSSEQVRAAE